MKKLLASLVATATLVVGMAIPAQAASYYWKYHAGLYTCYYGTQQVSTWYCYSRVGPPYIP